MFSLRHQFPAGSQIGMTTLLGKTSRDQFMSKIFLPKKSALKCGQNCFQMKTVSGHIKVAVIVPLLA